VTGYPASLDQLWAQHQAPRAPDAPTCVSLFSGCGGSSLGYSAAGYRELLAAEWDARACQVFRRNFGGVPVYEGDVTALDPGSLTLPVGGLDLLDSSPPCQGVSMTGLRRAADPRNQLWREVIRLAAAWRPRVIVLENVPGLVRGAMRAVFRDICAAFHELGYQAEARLVDASQLGVPQARVRVFIVAVRSDLGAAPAFPAPRTRPVTVREAWEGLDDPGAFDVPSGKGAVLAPLVEPGRNGSDALRRRGGKAVHFSAVRLDFGKPSPTLVREVRPGTSSGFLHPREDRFIGTRELARLQSFPDQWGWAGLAYRDVHNLVGNSVPPLVSRAVGEALLPLLVARAVSPDLGPRS
jgi:DNA (cytosine-5)-methyltransferase 1